MSTNTNPLLSKFELKDQASPFDLIKTEHFLPAIENALTEAKSNIANIKANKEISFQNTILALESASEKIDTISGIYFNLFSAEANEEHQALAQKISPILSEADSKAKIVF